MQPKTLNTNLKKQPSKRPLSPELKERVRKFSRGELTWAEVEGISYDQAANIARTGCDLAAKGKFEDARVIFEGLTALNPKDTSAFAALGTVYQRLGRLGDARQAYDTAVALFGNNVVALAGRGELRLRQGDRMGIDDLIRAAEIDKHGVTRGGRRARGILTAVMQKVAEVQQAAK